MKKEPEIRLDPAVADQMLSNIFDVCEYEGNTVPLTVLSSYKNYRKERNYLQRGIVTVILVALLLLPILFITPDVSVEKVGAYGGKPAIWLGYHSLLPIEKIQADLEGTSLPVHETRKGHFLVYPPKNGSLEVAITLINGQTGRETFMVSNADVTAPSLKNSQRVGDLLILFLADDSGMLDFEGSYARTLQGKTLSPADFNRKEMSVTFRNPEENMQIFVGDPCGNILKLVYRER